MKRRGLGAISSLVNEADTQSAPGTPNLTGPISNIAAGTPATSFLYFIQAAQNAIVNETTDPDNPAGYLFSWNGQNFLVPIVGITPESYPTGNSPTIENFVIENLQDLSPSTCSLLWNAGETVIDPYTGNAYQMTNFNFVAGTSCAGFWGSVNLFSEGANTPGTAATSPIISIAEGGNSPSPVATLPVTAAPLPVSPGTPLPLTSAASSQPSTLSTFINQYGVYLALGAVGLVMLDMLFGRHKGVLS